MSDPAIDSLRAALAVAPEDATLRAMLAERLADRGRIDEAIEEYRAAIRSRPADPTLKLALARVFLATDRLGAAEILTDEVIRQDPATGEAHILRAQALLALNRPLEARLSYERAVEVAPQLADESFAIRVGLANGSSGPNPETLAAEAGLAPATEPTQPPRPEDIEVGQKGPSAAQPHPSTRARGQFRR